MKSRLTALVAAMLIAPAAYAQGEAIYKCVDAEGRATFTNVGPGRDCKRLDVGPITTVPAPRLPARTASNGGERVTPASFPRVDADTQRARDADRRLDHPSAAQIIPRLREIVAILRDGGMQPQHENCHNYGGQSWRHTRRLLDEVSGLRLVFDTANPVGSADWSSEPPAGTQSVWRFWSQVREAVDYIHIKDIALRDDGTRAHVLPGRGDSDVTQVLADYLARGGEGIAIEPHLGDGRFWPGCPDDKAERTFANVVEFGRRCELLARAVAP